MRLFDSNVVIDLVRLADEPLQRRLLGDGFAVSVITEIEVLGFHRISAPEEADLRSVLSAGQTLPLDAAVKTRAISVRQARKIGLADSVIAATALVHGLPLATRNTDDFKNIPGLVLVDPFALFYGEDRPR